MSWLAATFAALHSEQWNGRNTSLIPSPSCPPSPPSLSLEPRDTLRYLHWTGVMLGVQRAAGVARVREAVEAAKKELAAATARGDTAAAAAAAPPSASPSGGGGGGSGSAGIKAAPRLPTV